MKKTNEPTYQINGRVIDKNSKRGIAGLRVEAWDKDLVFDDLVGSSETDTDGRFRIEFSGSYFRELFFDREPDLFFKVFSGRELIKSTQDSVMWNARAGVIPVEIAVTWSGDQKTDVGVHTVSGTVTSPNRAGVGRLRVEIVDKNVGQDVPLAETVTDERGRYKVSFTPASLGRKSQPDLQARVSAGRTFLAASEVHYNATPQETLNVSLPANSAALPSEYETLIAALTAQYDGRLADLKEADDRQDITYLANKTGWDARAVALAALADQLSRQGVKAGAAPAIKPAFHYALLRAGLPANPDTLYQADPQTVERVWTQAIKQGVIPEALGQEIGGAVSAFQRLGTQKLLSSPALVGTSSVREMLAASHLAEPQQKQFAELYIAHRTDMPKFWQEVRDAFGADTANRLEVDGKLGFLTINNAPLMQQLHTAVGGNGISDPLELAQQGFHRAEQWGQLLNGHVSVPKEIPGDTAEVKRANYAAYLAAQVRLSYPTASVAQMVRSGALAVNAPGDVHTFLTAHQGKFEIGVLPVQQYIARNQLDVPEETVKEVKRLERVLQITPSDQALTGLMKRGIDAAYQVVRFEKERFIETFAEDLGGTESAAQTYDRSVQVHNAVLNIAISYLTAKNGIGLGASPLQAPQQGSDATGQVLQPTPKDFNATSQALQPTLSSPAVVRGETNAEADVAAHASDVLAYGTLESLFGEMDFCACDHCRSILSPAAYLVDLLFFIDQAPTEADKENPQTVLLQRRPDINQLPLTCENTNTALPYIDVVNETLEYFITNSPQPLSLDGYDGHDTDGTASEDLLASPQFVIDAAYTILRGERFPAPLPFHQPLENLRRYFEKFEVSLPLAMQRLRKSDDLERGTNPYGWRDILMEEIGLSRAEHEILTNGGLTLAQIYGFPVGTTEAAAIAALSNAKAFTRRLEITYDDIAAILKTRFVNPHSDLVPKLERLGVPFATLQALKDGTITGDQFDRRLPTGPGAPNPAEYDNDIKGWVRRQDNFDRIMGIITLTDPTVGGDSCSFDNLEFRHTKPMAAPDDKSTRLSAVEFVRLLRFIRLWKKLGWTIEQTDAAICALFPVPPFSPGAEAAEAIDTNAKLDAGFLTLLPRLGIVGRIIDALNLTPKRDLLSLLAFWSSLGTHGDSALYRQMFLSPALRKQDATFADNGYGEFLQDNTQKLLGHVEALRAAFGLAGDEFFQILAALRFDADSVDVSYTHPRATLEQPILAAGPGIGYDHINHRLSFNGVLSTTARDALKAVTGVSLQFQDAVDALYAANQATLTTLTLDNVSAIYRWGWLARKLKISVRELLLLTQLTGLDPFAAPDPTNPAVLRIIELVQALKVGSLKSSVALYLIWNQNLSGKSAPGPAQITGFARTLRGNFAQIESEFAISDDPTGEIARARMALVYGTEATDFFFGLLNETFTVDAPYAHFQETFGTVLATAIRNAAGEFGNPALPRLAYDDFRKRLTFTGILDEARREAIKLVALEPTVIAEITALPPPSSLAAFQAAFPLAVDALYAANRAAVGPFFARYGELLPFYTTFIQSNDPPQTKRSVLLANFIPTLVKRRKEQQALQLISDAAQTERAFAETLLNPSPVSSGLHAADQTAEPALSDLLALETLGLSVQFYDSDTVGSNPQPQVIAANLAYAAATSNTLPPNLTAPGNAISGMWSGYLEAPENGLYNLIIEAEPGATVTLTIDGNPAPLTQTGAVWRNAAPLALGGGTLYEVELKAERVRNTFRVQWETAGRGRAVIPARSLYPATGLAAARDAYVRFLKSAALATALGLTAAETARPILSGATWLNVLPVVGNAVNPATLLSPLMDLLNYARIKADLSPGDDRLFDAMSDPVKSMQGVGGADSLLLTLTRWDSTSLDDILAHTGDSLAGLSSIDRFSCVYDIFGLIQKLGISARALIKAVTNEPTGDTVRDLQAALRARYEPADWRTVVQTINDQMRDLQRDALVAYILHQMRANLATEHINTPEKLFEYFLMDVQMEPCMQTSRIRHALSSVQLFIERCLMNLEPRVSPASIIAKRWEWMKRYRVWEANRKVFIFPENWLEPELRDDKSPFFKEIESELLQSDITEESATTALLNYLAKLEEVAKLEPCGIYHGENVDHVIARTAGAQRKYYYRRYEFGSWTPWEQIKLDIEDNPVMPFVWNDRLLLFWLRILKQAPIDPNELPTSSDTTGAATSLSLEAVKTDAKSSAQSSAKVTVQAVLCWSEYYNGKWQSAKTSDINRPAELGHFNPTGPHAFDRSKLRLSVLDASEGLALRISGQGTSSFVLFNTHSLPLRQSEAGVIVFPFIGPIRLLDTWSNSFNIIYYDGLLHLTSDGSLSSMPLERPVLENPQVDRTTEPQHSMPDPWEAPFFYEDSRHVFYVTTTQQPVFIFDYRGFGFEVDPGVKQVVQIPPVILPTKLRPDPPRGLGDGGPIDPDPVVDIATMQRFVTEDAYIRQGLGNTGSVMYGGKQIGPAGALTDTPGEI